MVKYARSMETSVKSQIDGQRVCVVYRGPDVFAWMVQLVYNAAVSLAKTDIICTIILWPYRIGLL